MSELTRGYWEICPTTRIRSFGSRGLVLKVPISSSSRQQLVPYGRDIEKVGVLNSWAWIPCSKLNLQYFRTPSQTIYQISHVHQISYKWRESFLGNFGAVWFALLRCFTFCSLKALDINFSSKQAGKRIFHLLRRERSLGDVSSGCSNRQSSGWTASSGGRGEVVLDSSSWTITVAFRRVVAVPLAVVRGTLRDAAWGLAGDSVEDAEGPATPLLFWN